ncbi:putative L-PSP family endoribonuclease [Aspergillus ambiguus]|uniref:YjgH family protein n=1 Tax=Aspergillus ambiguus TaxID=176160 RepID=UPI003CCCD762
MSSTSTPKGTVHSVPTGSKQLYATSSPFEQKIGYYRAVRHGSHIFVSGTTAVDPQSPPTAPQILYPGDARQQTQVALEECIAAVRALGGTEGSVVRVRMFVANAEDCMKVGEGFREVLGKHRGGEVGAAATMIVVQNGFVDGRMLVEVEVDAVAE